MTVRRIMGTETEFGISVLGTPSANPMQTSSQVVNAYAAMSARSRRARWDFEEENPLRDARGFDLSRAMADPSQLTDEDVGLANLILTNGARLYVDHAHPEYSTPECTNPRDVVVWDKAGDSIVVAAAGAVSIPGQNRIVLYKNNTDNKGASYGSHENYLMRRSTPFTDIVRHLTPFFVSRQVVCGAGRVGIGQDGRTAGFQVSQRADFFEVEVGLETTLKRPIINTRDEPHADPEKYRRLHVIVGDANLAEISTFLKVGTTSLVLSMIEDRVIGGANLAVDGPVEELHKISHDPTLKHLITLKDGRKLTAVELQQAYLDLARGYVEDRFGDDVDDQTRDVLDRWESVLDRLAGDPMSCRRELDWVAKLSLLSSYRDRDGLEWDDPKLHLVDLQYADLRPEKGLYQRLVSRGSIDRLLSDKEVRRAMTEPPEDTRAYFRGRCLAQYADQIAAASWDSVIFDLPGRDSLQRVPTMEPARGTRQHVGALLDSCETAEELFAAITS